MLKTGGGQIHPVHKGLGDSISELQISISKNNSGSNTLTLNNNDDKNKAMYYKDSLCETVEITTLDAFVESHNLNKIDFIKSDIEGYERNLLTGARKTLKTFAPKLAICTYHLPDDPEILENIIKEANPDYKIVHLRHKLFAMVIN